MFAQCRSATVFQPLAIQLDGVGQGAEIALHRVGHLLHHADGGKVATKPYISGGNYLSKMGRWGDATSGLDEFTRLYWEFLSNNYDKLKTNPRMSLVLKLSIDKQ